jgi:hypothetical protein
VRERLFLLLKSKKGFVGAVILFYGAIRSVISFLGDITFAMDYVGPAVDFLASGAGNLVAIGLGVLLLLWALYSQETASESVSSATLSPEAIPGSATTNTTPQHPPRPPREITDDLASASYIKDQALYIFDLTRRRAIIKGKTFEDCDIHGPAVAAVLNGTDFIDCTFAEGGDHSSLVWLPDPSRGSYVGAIGLEECIFRRCNFRDVGLLTRLTYGDEQGEATDL